MRGSETWAKSTSYLFSLWWDWVWTFNDPIRKSQTYWISHVTQNSNSYFDCAFFQITNLDHYSSVSKNGIKTQWTTFDEISRQVLNWTERLSHHCFRFSQAIAFFTMKKNQNALTAILDDNWNHLNHLFFQRAIFHVSFNAIWNCLKCSIWTFYEFELTPICFCRKKSNGSSTNKMFQLSHLIVKLTRISSAFQRQ